MIGGENASLQKIGTLDGNIIKALKLDLIEDSPIFLGADNILHMKQKHPKDYAKYGNCIEDIIRQPDYIGKNPKDESIEYVKEFFIENEFVKVAVRVSGNGVLFARSMYVLNPNRVLSFIEKGTLFDYCSIDK